MLLLMVHTGDYVTINDNVVMQMLKVNSLYRVVIEVPQMDIESAKV